MANPKRPPMTITQALSLGALCLEFEAEDAIKVNNKPWHTEVLEATKMLKSLKEQFESEDIFMFTHKKGQEEKPITERIKAILANVGKGKKGMPPTSFSELVRSQEANKLAEQYRMLADNILYSDAVQDKPAALKKLADEYAALQRGESLPGLSVKMVDGKSVYRFEWFDERTKGILENLRLGIKPVEQKSGAANFFDNSHPVSFENYKNGKVIK